MRPRNDSSDVGVLAGAGGAQPLHRSFTSLHAARLLSLLPISPRLFLLTLQCCRAPRHAQNMLRDRGPVASIDGPDATRRGSDPGAARQPVRLLETSNVGREPVRGLASRLPHGTRRVELGAARRAAKVGAAARRPPRDCARRYDRLDLRAGRLGRCRSPIQASATTWLATSSRPGFRVSIHHCPTEVTMPMSALA